MREVCLGGPGHYLGTDQTLSRMQSDFVYPGLGDRTSPKEWAENGKPDLIENAINQKNDILGQPSTVGFDPILDRAIRDKFNIHLNG